MARQIIRPRTEDELHRMRHAGWIVARVLDALGEMIAPGVATQALDDAAAALIAELGGKPSFKGYYGYPASICTSVNEEIVHGIPGPRRLVAGDIVSVDAGAIWEGWQGDGTRTFAVGDVPSDVQHLLDVTEASLMAGIAQARNGQRLGDISHAVEQVARDAGLEVIREYGGHGIGTRMHEPPRISNWGPAGRGPVLERGMTLAIEPMLCMGSPRTRRLADGWTVVTADGSLAAHFEHTIAVTDAGGEVLTKNTDHGVH